MPPPGSFGSVDPYCHKRWRRTQHTLNTFWVDDTRSSIRHYKNENCVEGNEEIFRREKLFF